jgi:hypothetical protein
MLEIRDRVAALASQMAHKYQPPVAEFLRKLVKPGFVCFDVGANVALYTWNLQEGMRLD